MAASGAVSRKRSARSVVLHPSVARPSLWKQLRGSRLLQKLGRAGCNTVPTPPDSQRLLAALRRAGCSCCSSRASCGRCICRARAGEMLPRSPPELRAAGEIGEPALEAVARARRPPRRPRGTCTAAACPARTACTSPPPLPVQHLGGRARAAPAGAASSSVAEGSALRRCPPRANLLDALGVATSARTRRRPIRRGTRRLAAVARARDAAPPRRRRRPCGTRCATAAPPPLRQRFAVRRARAGSVAAAAADRAGRAAAAAPWRTAPPRSFANRSMHGGRRDEDEDVENVEAEDAIRVVFEPKRGSPRRRSTRRRSPPSRTGLTSARARDRGRRTTRTNSSTHVTHRWAFVVGGVIERRREASRVKRVSSSSSWRASSKARRRSTPGSQRRRHIRAAECASQKRDGHSFDKTL